MPRTTGKPLWPAKWEDFDAHSIQAFFQGKATEAQQKRVVDYLQRASAGYGRSAVMDSANETFFNEGRRDVWRQLLYLSQIDMSAVADLRARAKRKEKLQ